MGDPRRVQRRLVLLRHAKSAYPEGVQDHDRPLAGKGRRNARAAATWLHDHDWTPDLVLCSTALRARQTWDLIGGQTPRTLLPALYEADAQDVVAAVRAVADAVQTVVVVGHEPSMSETTVLLAGEGSSAVALERVRLKYPTNGVAVLRFVGRWAALAPGGAALETFAVPRAQ